MNRAFSRAECFWTTPPMKPSGNDTRQVLRISPSSGFSWPAIMLMIVVLPVPLGARMPSERPSSTRNEARSRITLRCCPVQKDLLTSWNSSIDGAPRTHTADQHLRGLHRPYGSEHGPHYGEAPP